MDISKLPRLSKTETPGAEPAPPAAAIQAFCTQCGAALGEGMRFCGACGARVGGAPVLNELPPLGAEAAIGIVVGLILILMWPNTWRYALSAFGIPFTPFVDPITLAPVDYILMTDGSKIAYRQLINFWSDLVIALFAAALLVEGVALLLLRRLPLAMLLSVLLTATAGIANLLYVALTYRSYGLAIVSIVAALFAVFMAIRQWRLACWRLGWSKAR